jgi:hypothetical protein
MVSYLAVIQWIPVTAIIFRLKDTRHVVNFGANQFCYYTSCAGLVR